MNQKEIIEHSTSWAWLLKTKMSTEPIISQSLYPIPNNKIMSKDQIFQDINK
jgi:hypothetical protein